MFCLVKCYEALCKLRRLLLHNCQHPIIRTLQQCDNTLFCYERRILSNTLKPEKYALYLTICKLYKVRNVSVYYKLTKYITLTVFLGGWRTYQLVSILHCHCADKIIFHNNMENLCNEKMPKRALQLTDKDDHRSQQRGKIQLPRKSRQCEKGATRANT